MKNLNLPIISMIAALVFSACQSPNAVSPDAVLLKGVIRDSTARRLVTNFSPRAHIFKRGGIVLPDTRSIWFSAAQLKAFAQKVEDEHGDGVRFYLAAYDSTRKSDLPAIKDAYLGYGTMIMVSTIPMGVGKHLDYYSDQKASGMKKGGIIMAVPENQGELCPPPAHCQTEGATLLQ